MKQFNGVYKLWSPDGPALTWSPGETTLILCTGSDNSITITSSRQSKITCLSGVSFNIDGSTQNSKDLQCQNTMTGQSEITSDSCWLGTGKMQRIGFSTASLSIGFITYIDLCYNWATGSVRYTRHIIPGRAIDYSATESERPTFKSVNTAAHVSPATSYSQESQLERLTDLLGSQEQASKFIYINSFFARGHLTPAADGIFRSWQYATFFYTNVAPQFQSVNAANWVRVENAARKKASASQADLLIFTGNEGILTLPHEDGREIPISLEVGGIEVPKWFWKIIKNQSTNEGIALITLNNPFATSVESLCPDICGSFGWDNTNFGDYKKGYTYCCSVESLMAAVPGIPSDAAVEGVLAFA